LTWEVFVETLEPAAGEARDDLLGSFIEAARAALGEMAGTEVTVGGACQQAPEKAPGDLVVTVGLTSAAEDCLVLRFPGRTAAALAGRILAGVAEAVDADLVRDCVGEIANVVAGQAKAMLAGTPYRFTFSLPRVLGASDQGLPAPRGQDCLAVAFTSELGEFTMQLFLKR
jgi:chemotaxis protein CheX